MESKCSQDNLLLNFSLSPLIFKPSGFRAGRFKNFSHQSFCYVNNNDLLLISKHLKTNQLMICQLTLKSNEAGQVIDYSNYSEFSFSLSDEFRIYDEVRIAKTGVGSRSLSEYMKVEERKYQNNFFIKYNQVGKTWVGCWGSPKKNLNLKIQQIMIFLAKERNLAFVQSEETKFFCFIWCLSPSKNQQNKSEQILVSKMTSKYNYIAGQ